MSSTDPFAGRVAVVTGAGAGIGVACARVLAARGATLALVDRDAGALERTAASLDDRGDDRGHRRYVTDLADPEACRQLLPTVHADLGRLDVLVNNAADVGRRLELADVDAGEWDRIIATNLTAPFLLAQGAAELMLPDAHASIVNVGSIQRRLPLARHVPYVASKGGLDGLTRALAVELAPRGIRVNAVEPGVIETPGLAEERDHSGGDQDMRQATLSGDAGTPDDVADAVAFLADPAATHITGATLTVDGGRSISRHPDPLASR